MELERGAVIYRHSISGFHPVLEIFRTIFKIFRTILEIFHPLWIINVALKKSAYKNVGLKKSAYNKQWVEKVCLRQTMGSKKSAYNKRWVRREQHRGAWYELGGSPPAKKKV